MNKPVIKSYEDLLQEQDRLRKQLNVQKTELNGRIRDVKEKLAPIGTIIGAIGSISAFGAKHPMIKSGVGLAVDMFVKKRLFKKSGLVTGILGSFLLRNVATKVAAGAAGALITTLIKKFTHRKSEKPATQG